MKSTYQNLFADTDMRSVVAAITSITAVGTGLGLSSPLLSLLMERDGISSAVIGLNTSVSGIAEIIVIPFVTALSLRFGVVNTVVCCILLSGLFLATHYFTDPIPSWFVVRFLFGCALSIVFVLSEFWINHAANEKNRGLVLGIYGTVLSLGFASGPLLISAVGIDGFLPFALGALIIIAATIPPLFARKGQPLMQSEGKTPPIMPYLFMVPAATAAGFVFGAVEQSQFALLPIFATKAGYSEGTASFLLTVMLLGNVVFQIPLGIWSDKVRDRRTILLFCSLIGLAGSFLIVMFVDNVIYLYLIAIIWGGAISGMYTVGLAHLGSRLHGTDLAQANAAFVLCYGIGMIFGPQIVGLSMDQFGVAGFGGSIAIFFVGFLCLYFYRKLKPTPA